MLRIKVPNYWDSKYRYWRCFYCDGSVPGGKHTPCQAPDCEEVYQQKVQKHLKEKE